MTEEKKYNDFGKGPEGIARTVVFMIVAIVIVSSFALPVLASVGERSGTINNNGVRMSNLNDYDWQSIWDSFDEGTADFRLTSFGLGIRGQIDGEYVTKYLTEYDEFDLSYPIIMYHNVQPYQAYVLTRNTETNRYITTSYFEQTSSVVTIFWDPHEWGYYDFWFQDPEGKYVMNTGGMSYNEGDSVLGFYVGVGEAINFTLSDTWWCNGGSWFNVTPDIDSSEKDGYTTLENVSYGGTDCQYYIGPLSATKSYNILEGTQVGAMIGLIPTLMIIGVILYLARNLRRSDR